VAPRVLPLPARLAEHRAELDPVSFTAFEAGLDGDERADRDRRPQLDLDAARERERASRMDCERHRLVERRRDDAAVREPRRPLVVLLHEEAAADAALVERLGLELKPEEVRDAASEAQVVVGEMIRQTAPPARSGATGSALGPPGFSREMYSSSVIGKSRTRSATSSSSDIVATSSTCSFRNHWTNCSLR